MEKSLRIVLVVGCDDGVFSRFLFMVNRIQKHSYTFLKTVQIAFGRALIESVWRWKALETKRLKRKS